LYFGEKKREKKKKKEKRKRKLDLSFFKKIKNIFKKVILICIFFFVF
jgi:hypothetical protein